MRLKFWTYKGFSTVCFVISMMLFVLSMLEIFSDTDLESIANRTSRIVESRLNTLDGFVCQGEGQAAVPGKLPEDMVIYRYVNDSLKAWSNQFPTINDDISAKLEIQKLTSQRSRIVSPLTNVTEELTFMNLGPKWYLIKSFDGNNGEKTIAGLEIQNTLMSDMYRAGNGVNPNLRLSDRFIILPLQYSEGSPVEINGTPLFKIANGPTSATGPINSSSLRWLALLFFAASAVLFLSQHRSIRAYIIVNITLISTLIVSFIWGQQMSESSNLFSPTLYADGTFFSLGALLLTNVYVALFNVCAYLIRRRIISQIRQKASRAKLKKSIYGLIVLTLAIASVAYVHYSLTSLINNSSLTLELYRWNDQIFYTILVYLSYSGIFISILLLLQMLRPTVWKLTGISYNLFSRKGLACMAFIWALYMTVTAGILGFQKEEDRVQVWANRLAVDRNISLEIQLRNLEEDIAADQILWTLATHENTEETIQKRISEYYLIHLRHSFRPEIILARVNDPESMAHLEHLISTGVPITDGSRFLVVRSGGRNSYAGIFAFYSPDSGTTHMILEIEPDNNAEDKGYFTLLKKQSNPGSVIIPPVYSYAKYDNNRLSSYKGNFPYPTSIPESADIMMRAHGRSVVRDGGYVHFHHYFSEDEIIAISRPTRTPMVFFTSFSYLFLCLTLLMQLFVRGRKTRQFKTNYFRTRINSILFISSFLILASITVISVLFVYRRNEMNMHNLMSSKISTIQAMVETKTRHADSWKDLTTPEFAQEIEKISATTQSDISVFTPEGKVFRSTSPEVYEKMIIGSRIDPEAYYNICRRNQRYYISRTEVAGIKLWTLYAPVFNEVGELVAIINSPYTDRSLDFRREATTHAAMIVNLFLLLLIVSLLFTTKEVNEMFAPLVEMGHKMKSADINHLEYIVYSRDDEISSLVDAYNRMVKELYHSTRQLAQAERDNAWSQMARQVAHEIKNPLTPIKLELQRLIRLKQKNNPAWEEKFDQVAAVILEHIDILSDTANEFSTFAKLYSEPPTLLDLDKILKDQLLIFDNKENVEISYVGMEGAMAMAPKPQLIRVFVNLITNAIQAVEIRQKEIAEHGGEHYDGKVMIFLRNSTKEGYYDIVVDDNGSGVSEENLDKLFTPNFTTKSSGTGLGLAICRNIIEKCNGEISYQKSFVLGGASFTVTIPMKSED
jgi:signal transduction histidine kinase